ncbi:MAG: tyrosine--tRNA ligase [Candidatus Pacearchaeota archaeon]|nr:tyrosine--tRNA ligase [Candidatus Pacearchaeota archaeon]
MELKKRLELIKRNVVEIVTEKEFEELLKKKKNPVVYCGYEPSGPLHLGHFVTILKLMDLANAGFEVKVLLADVHALLNRKGGAEEINKETQMWKKIIKAIGLKSEIILGSEFQFDEMYQLDVMKLAQEVTINRGLRSMQEIARDIEHATISQLWYPLMQVVDIKHLKADVALGGLEQRKVHMIGKELNKVLNYDFVAMHTPLITSLKGPGQKMSKSIPGSCISITDPYEEIKKTIKEAYCPEKVAQDNPILQIAKLIIFPTFNKIKIERAVKFGGTIEIHNYKELETIYIQGKLHPLDLKNSVSEYLEKIIAPIRKKFKPLS